MTSLVGVVQRTGHHLRYDGDDNTVLRGPLIDEAALHGVLIKVRDLALPLLAVNRIEALGEEQERTSP